MAHESPGDLLIFQIPYNRYTFDYYAGQGQPWIDGPYTNNGQDQAFVDDWMARGTLGARQRLADRCGGSAVGRAWA